jgi:hypothetical protein
MKTHKRPEKANRKEKALITRVPVELWEYVMITAIETRSTMTDIIEDIVRNWMNKREKRLTTNDNKIK